MKKVLSILSVLCFLTLISNAQDGCPRACNVTNTNQLLSNVGDVVNFNINAITEVPNINDTVWIENNTAGAQIVGVDSISFDGSPYVALYKKVARVVAAKRGSFLLKYSYNVIGCLPGICSASNTEVVKFEPQIPNPADPEPSMTVLDAQQYISLQVFALHGNGNSIKEVYRITVPNNYKYPATLKIPVSKKGMYSYIVSDAAKTKKGIFIIQ